MHGLTGNPLQRHALHMTLLYLGHIPGLQRVTLDRARDGAAGVNWHPFDIVLDRVKTLPNRRPKRPFVLMGPAGNAALSLFRRELVTAMRSAGLIHSRPPSFTPHVTLAWDSAFVRETPYDATITWTVREFQLVFSVFGQGRHECLGRWPLKA